MPYHQEFKEIDPRKVQRQFTLYRNYTPGEPPVSLGPLNPQPEPPPAGAVVQVYEIGQTGSVDIFPKPRRRRHLKSGKAHASLGERVVEYLAEHGACTSEQLVEALGAAHNAAISWATWTLRNDGKLEKWSMDAGFVHTPLGASLKRRSGCFAEKLHDKVRSSDSPVYPTPLAKELGVDRGYLISRLGTITAKGELKRVSESFWLYALPGYEPSAHGQRVIND